jgi:hypothetical protein
VLRQAWQLRRRDRGHWRGGSDAAAVRPVATTCAAAGAAADAAAAQPAARPAAAASWPAIAWRTARPDATLDMCVLGGPLISMQMHLDLDLPKAKRTFRCLFF